MQITNRSGFPEALALAISKDTYNKGASDFSITELLKPPQAVALSVRHKDKMVDDVEDRLWSFYGQIAHLILERANVKDLSEERFYSTFTVDGVDYVVSGQIDSLSLEKGTLTDWKFTTSWGFKEGKSVKPEWEAQLNMQLELLRRNGRDAQALQIVGLLRDWSKREAKRTDDYPKKPVQTHPCQMWERKITQSFIEERIRLHVAARSLPDDSLPLCSEEEMWAKPTVWAVCKGDRAIRFGLCPTIEAAQALQAKNPGTRIEFRPGERGRCADYCDAANFCHQYKAFKEGK